MVVERSYEGKNIKKENKVDVALIMPPVRKGDREEEGEENTGKSGDHRVIRGIQRKRPRCKTEKRQDRLEEAFIESLCLSVR